MFERSGLLSMHATCMYVPQLHMVHALLVLIMQLVLPHMQHEIEQASIIICTYSIIETDYGPHYSIRLVPMYSKVIDSIIQLCFSARLCHTPMLLLNAI